MARAKSGNQQFGEWLESHIKALEGVKNGVRSWNEKNESALEQAKFIFKKFYLMTGYTGPKRY